jgi:hypothetical protein
MSKKRESLLWLQLKDCDKKAHFTRVESNTVNGIPDVHCVFNKQIFWLELKSNDDKNCGLSKWQINWHIKYLNAGGKVFILNRPLKDSALEILAVCRESRTSYLVHRTADVSKTGIQSCLQACCSVKLDSRAKGSRFSYLAN